MAQKRKDHKNRVLHDGESQRKDLTYQYRFTDNLGKRRTVYAKTLEDLRKKEQQIRKDLEFGLNYADGRLTVNELLERYISLKKGVRYNTKVGYQFVLNLVRNDPFGERFVKDIKVSDAKRWFLQLHENGKGYSTITSVRGVVKPAFQMAVDEDIVIKNPFLFKITDVIPNDSEKRIALTDEQQRLWLDFMRSDKNGRPKVSLHIENEIRWGLKKYHKLHPDKPLPHITPHVLRHTFCTNMANAGMDLKSLQYLMGHSDASVTMNVYTHPNYDRAAEQLRNITEFGSVNRLNAQQKMG